MKTTGCLVPAAAGLVRCLVTATGYAEPQAVPAPAEPPKTEATVVPATSPLAMPAMAGPLAASQKPLTLDAGPLGSIYVSGVVSGFAQQQNHVSPGDKTFQPDISNAQVFVQKINGPVQFFAQFGEYSLPALGVPYMKASTATDSFYGVFPQWFIKFAPNDSFSVQVGKLPTLIGAEYTFTFENANIQRGLLWNQENAVNRGVQVNYTAGPLALSASVNDGMYSKKYSWAWLSGTYTIDKENTLALIVSGNTKRTTVSTTATPLFQNNEQLHNLIYTHTAGPWTIQPYLQYTKVPADAAYGTTQDASTTGAALLATYAFDGGLSLASRAEYIKSTGSASSGAPNLLYGQGSKAWSLSLTPTYQYKNYFLRGEFSYVKANNVTSGMAFGPSGNDTSQTRFLLEGGLIF